MAASVQQTALGEAAIFEKFFPCSPVIILGSGTPLFQDIKDGMNLKQTKVKTFLSGVVRLRYESDHH